MNKKGMTLVEIIVAIVLVSIVMILFLNLFITVQTYNNQNKNASELLINQSVIVKAVEKDINDYKLVKVSVCDDDILTVRKYQIIPTGATNIYCLKLTYGDDSIEDNEGYIVEYTYNYKDSTTKNVAGYKRGSNEVVREIGFMLNPASDKGTVTTSCPDNTSEYCSLRIKVPVIDDNGDDYGIVISYIYKYSELTYENGDAYGFQIR